MSGIQASYNAVPSGGAYGRTRIGADYYDEAGDAAERQAYYQPVADTFSKSSGRELFNNLHNLLAKTHRPAGDLPGPALYSIVDRRPDGALYTLYSGQGPKNEEQVKERNNRDLEGYNLEHVVPKSWFDSQLPMRDDLHHLFTESRQCNSDRGNLPFREVMGNAKKLPDCGSKVGEDAFEPGAGKGEIARAVLYFVTRHPGLVGDSPDEMNAADIPTLLKWHAQYPVTDYERHRNESIQDVQGNRNPYIDFPELVSRVDFQAGFGHTGRR